MYNTEESEFARANARMTKALWVRTPKLNLSKLESQAKCKMISQIGRMIQVSQNSCSETNLAVPYRCSEGWSTKKRVIIRWRFKRPRIQNTCWPRVLGRQQVQPLGEAPAFLRHASTAKSWSRMMNGSKKRGNQKHMIIPREKNTKK